jgi:TRAP-type C4-dicarboxylate transport system permease small subunit
MVMALSLSAITRYISGTGYDWLIELPPILVCWLVFPLLGPLLKEGNHIQVDFLSSLVSSTTNKYIKISMNITAFLASLIFFKAGFDATALYYRLGQMMELELDIPIWWMYLSFPVGFVILALFSIEMTIQSILTHKKSVTRQTDVPFCIHIISFSSLYICSNFFSFWNW